MEIAKKPMGMSWGRDVHTVTKVRKDGETVRWGFEAFREYKEVTSI